MARYLLDSNAFINAKATPEKLGQETLQAIKSPDNLIFVSPASFWELGIKSANGKLSDYAQLIAAGVEGLEDSLRQSSFQLLAISLRHALAAPQLPQHHKDPFDRMLIAQAMEEGLVLITSDRVFTRYAGLRVLAA